MRYYPVFLNLKGKKVLVVGGGKVAERKILTLIKTGASLTVISPRITKPLSRLKKKGLITHIEGHYKKGDLRDAFVVIAATSSLQTNSRVARDAGQLKEGLPRLINVIDAPSEGNFIVPSIMRRGPLTIAISTGGYSPAMAKNIRKELERLYDSGFGKYLRFLGKIRKRAMDEIKDNKKRERFFRELASEEIFSILRSKGFKAASEKIIQLL